MDASVETNGDGAANVQTDNAGVSVNEDGVHVQGGGVDVKVGSDGSVNIQTP